MRNHEVIESGGVTILKLNVQSLDALTVPELRPAIEQLVERGGVKVVVDMSSVEVIDSSGVGVIVSDGADIGATSYRWIRLA